MAKKLLKKNDRYSPENVKRYSVISMVTVIAGLIGEMVVAMGKSYSNCGEFEVIEPNYNLVKFLAFYAMVIIVLSLGILGSRRPTKFPAVMFLIPFILLNAVAFLLIGLHFAMIALTGGQSICL